MSPALRAMVEELRSEAPPELPWDAMERTLLDRIGRGEGGKTDRTGAALWQAAGFAAAAAALVALFASAGGNERVMEHEPSARVRVRVRVIDARAVRPAPGATGDRDLAALQPGDAVEASDQPISFARARDARFTLAAGSRAVIAASSAAPARTVLELERGAVRAEVEPRDPAEGILDAFVIEAGRTRIAVRGTAFSVARAEDRIDVDVEHGTVAVGLAGRAGVLMATSLVGPARASFSLDGVRLATLPPGNAAFFGDRSSPAPSEPAVIPPLTLLAPPAPNAVPSRPEAPPPSPASAPSEAPAPVAAPPAAAAASSDAADAAAAKTPTEPPAPPAPSLEAATAPAEAAPRVEPPSFLTPASIKAGVERCFTQIYSARQTQVKLSIASTMRITVRADGTVQSAAFDPPLAPSFQLCAGSAIAGRFKSGPQTITIPVSFGP
jgi:hypothetical protein